MPSATSCVGGVYGGLINHHVFSLVQLDLGFAGLDRWGHVGAISLVNCRTHLEDEHLCGLEVVQVVVGTRG